MSPLPSSRCSRFIHLSNYRTQPEHTRTTVSCISSTLPARFASAMAYSQPFPRAQPIDKPQAPPTFGPDLAVRLICPNCADPNPNIIEEFSSGDLVCGTCGLVLGDRVVDTRSEWRVSVFPLWPSRVGKQLLLSSRTRLSRTTKETTRLVSVLPSTLSWRESSS